MSTKTTKRYLLLALYRLVSIPVAFLCVNGTIVTVNAQGQSTWIRAFAAGEWVHVVNALTPTGDGGMIVVGKCRWYQYDHENEWGRNDEIFIAKYDSFGNAVWSKYIGGSSNDEATEVITASDGGYIVGGRTSSDDKDFAGMNEGGVDVFLAKVSSSGDIKWLRTLGGSGWVYTGEIIASSDGGCCIQFYSSRPVQECGSLDGDILAFVDDDGHIRWFRAGGELIAPHKMSPKNGKGGALMVVRKEKDKRSRETLWIESINNNDGSTAWRRKIQEEESETIDYCSTKDGGILLLCVGGVAEKSGGLKFWDALIIERYDSGGNRVSRSINSGFVGLSSITAGPSGGPISIVETESGDAVVGMLAMRSESIFSGTISKGEGDIALACIKGDGKVVWTRRYGGPGYDVLTTLRVLSDGSIACVVSSPHAGGDFAGQPKLLKGPRAKDFDRTYLLKLDPNGQLYQTDRKLKKY